MSERQEGAIYRRARAFHEWATHQIDNRGHAGAAGFVIAGMLATIWGVGGIGIAVITVVGVNESTLAGYWLGAMFVVSQYWVFQGIRTSAERVGEVLLPHEA